MRLAFTIGSYRLHDFIKLGIQQIQKLSPDSPILVSDDSGPESQYIQRTTEESGCVYRGIDKRRGHFGGDFQSIINSLVFAEAAGADVAVKVSQRFIFRKPESIDAIQRTFSDSNIMLATPGQPTVTAGGKAQKGFSAFTILTDIVCLRVGAIKAEDLLVMYRSRIINEKVPWKDFIECTIDQLHANQFNGKSARMMELTNQPNFLDPIYLRRYQNTEQQYRNLANENGWNGQFPLSEWGQIEQRSYMCHPVVV